MKIKLLAVLLVLASTFFGVAHKAFAEDSLGLDINLCIEQFPCHLKTGKLLPGFKAGTPCAWEKICQNYRSSSDFKKLQKKTQEQKRKNLKRTNPVHPRR